MNGATLPSSATIARRGIIHWQINAQGNGYHSMRIFQKTVSLGGFSSIFELTRILDTMRRLMEAEKDLSFSPELILAGTFVKL